MPMHATRSKRSISYDTSDGVATQTDPVSPDGNFIYSEEAVMYFDAESMHSRSLSGFDNLGAADTEISHVDSGFSVNGSTRETVSSGSGSSSSMLQHQSENTIENMMVPIVDEDDHVGGDEVISM